MLTIVRANPRPYFCAFAPLPNGCRIQSAAAGSEMAFMRIAEICSRPVFVAHPGQALASATREMRTRNVGALVVVAAGDTTQRPLGILTDRDVLRGQVERCADLSCLTVNDVMTRRPLCIRADAEVTEAIERLASRGVRRAPVIDDKGSLVGIVTLDDLLPQIAEQIKALAETATPRSSRFV
jgi:CBS domain-containing protein